MTTLAILIPLKDFDIAKERLRSAGVENVSDRAKALARAVIAASAPRPVFVVTESPAVVEFSRRWGAEPLLSEARDLNEAAHFAYHALHDRFDHIVFVHGDLANPEGLGDFTPGPGVTIVTDLRRRGTNVLALPAMLDFHFAYGPDSKEAHVTEAKRLGLEYRIVTESPWALDIDEPEDLEEG